MSLFILALGKCQNSSYSPNMNYLRPSHAQTQKYVICWDFLFLMTQTWPHSQEHFGSLPISDASAAGACWEEGCVVRSSSSTLGDKLPCQGWSGILHRTGMARPNLLCCAHVLVAPLDVEPHSSDCSCFKKLFYSSDTIAIDL